MIAHACMVLFCVLSGIASARTISQAELELLERVLASQTDPERLGCSYTLHSNDEQRGAVSERFDPYFENENPWSLIQIDGAQPTVDQLDSYQPIARERHPAILQFDLIDRSTLESLSVVANRANYKFRIRPEYSQALSANTEGTMVVNLFTEELSEIRIVAPEPFRINGLTKIERFDQFMRFNYEPLVGPVMELLVVRIGGRTMGEKFESSINLEFDDFDCSATSNPRSTTPVRDSESDEIELIDPAPSLPEALREIRIQ